MATAEYDPAADPETLALAATSPMEPAGIEPATSCLQSSADGRVETAERPEKPADSEDSRDSAD